MVYNLTAEVGMYRTNPLFYRRVYYLTSTPMSSSEPINYARAEGIHKSEIAGAIIFAVVYIPLFFHNVFRSVRRPTYVLIVLSVFCVSK